MESSFIFLRFALDLLYFHWVFSQVHPVLEKACRESPMHVLVYLEMLCVCFWRAEGTRHRTLKKNTGLAPQLYSGWAVFPCRLLFWLGSASRSARWRQTPLHASMNLSHYEHLRTQSISAARSVVQEKSLSPKSPKKPKRRRPMPSMCGAADSYWTTVLCCDLEDSKKKSWAFAASVSPRKKERSIVMALRGVDWHSFFLWFGSIWYKSTRLHCWSEVPSQPCQLWGIQTQDNIFRAGS